MDHWDEWMANGPPYTLTQKQRNGEMAQFFAGAVEYDKTMAFCRAARDLGLGVMYLRALKAERGQDAALSR
jgi:hypothetical protein